MIKKNVQRKSTLDQYSTHKTRKEKQNTQSNPQIKIKVSPYESHAMHAPYSASAPTPQHKISLLPKYHGRDLQRRRPCNDIN